MPSLIRPTLDEMADYKKRSLIFFKTPNNSLKRNGTALASWESRDT
jgi:hypothetical protein